jgi:hypothetical protein
VSGAGGGDCSRRVECRVLSKREAKNMVEDDARRLIRAINELQAKDRVGEQVSIDNVVTYHTGIGPDFDPESERCDAAVAYLVERGALEPDESLNDLDVVNKAYDLYRITQTGIDMARS